ncbi:hypothetical protein FACS189485_05610 [Spirochaetia bacterium]|nr:hypothetical protein FACS189485_05610 [Spirochaetia bacterium]
MFRKNALLRNTFSLFAVFALVIGALPLVGCNDDSGFVDDHKLNSGLIGIWSYGSDAYTINADTLVYTSTYEGVTTGFTSSIEYIYNFSETAGVIIVEYTTKPTYYDYDASWNPINPHEPEGSFIGIYFRNLTAATVKLGSAYEADFSEVEVATLAEAKEKFKPANISLYGGELSMTSPQTRQ